MITCQDGVFRLNTQNSSYWFRVTGFLHPEHIYYGPRLPDDQPLEALLLKRTAVTGSSIVYDQSNPLYVLDNMLLEWSGIGRGDYRHSPAELKMPDGSFVCDFQYQSFSIVKGVSAMEKLPGAWANGQECETLALHLQDISNQVGLVLYYTLFEKSDVLVRRVKLINHNEKELEIRRLLSMSLDMPDKGYAFYTLQGNWIKEAHLHSRPVTQGMFVNSSNTGASSNRSNPGFMLAENGVEEDSGNVYGFNLVYSGNHFGFIEKTSYELVRVGIGINPHCFSWILKKGEIFETPGALLCFSNQGFNGLSRQYHAFINDHIVRGEWAKKERPVLFNSWEAYFFKYDSAKLLKMARDAKHLGAELFVLDDGWFGKRDDDKSSLGDYTINIKKLPRGLNAFAAKIKGMGLKFGLWFEPEMISEDSDLYRAHPEYAVRLPDKRPTLGRNQLVLDLCSEEVRDYIVQNVGRILDGANVDYVKWDMNRHISDAYSPTLGNQGEFFHRYILGLYDVLQRIFGLRPHILFESCSSGGNRFDLGMLCFSPQIWASDNTDPVERISIQGGLSYLYPLSTMAAHVSEAPHQQTLRQTPLSTRFNVACFGALGYELGLKRLSPVVKKEIKDQIVFYKKYRSIFLYGRFDRVPGFRTNQTVFQCSDGEGNVALTGLFQKQAQTAPGNGLLRVRRLNPRHRYVMQTKPQRLYISRFGGLVKHILPVDLNPEGFLLRLAGRHYALWDCKERYEAYGGVFEGGIPLSNQFMGSYYNAQTELLGDFGSYIFVTQKREGCAGGGE